MTTTKEQPGTGASGSSGIYDSPDALLQSLERDTMQRVDNLAKPLQSNVLERINALQEQMDKVATQTKDAKTRDIKLAAFQAEFESLRAELPKEEEDLANAVMGLDALAQGFGADYDALQNPSKDELQMEQNAQAAVKTAEGKLAVAQARRFNLFGWKDSAIAEAQAEIDAAKANIGVIATQVKSLRRNRLMKANMEQSLQNFMMKVEKTIGIMKTRIEAIKIQVAAVSARKGEAFRIKAEAAKALEALDAELAQEEAQLTALETDLGTLINGSQEYVAQEAKISNLRVKVDDTRGRRNTALVLFQSKERFAAELEVHEKAQIKFRDNQIAWVTLLTSDTQERVVTYRSRLEAMKALSDQDIAANLDKVGVKTDQNNVDYMVKASSASDKARMEMLESQPERLRHIAEAQAALAAIQASIQNRERNVLEDFKRRYGIDPLESSVGWQTSQLAGSKA